MKNQIIAAAGLALALVAGPAFAGAWDEAKAVCADAIAAEAGLTGQAFDAKLEKARDGGVKRLTVKLTPESGASVVGECKVKSGEVVSVQLKA